MKTSQNGIKMIKQFEGCVLKVYLDAVKVKTVGYGHTGADINKLPVGTKITQKQADEYLISDLEKFEKKVQCYNYKYNWNQNQFDAMVSFAYNIGSIDQLTAKGSRSIQQISSKITEYTKAGGRVLAGLTKRRQSEKDLFDTPAVTEPVYSTTGNVNSYSKVQFIKAIQRACGAKVDGIAGSETLSNTVTLSASKNKKHAAVLPVQQYLKALGYTEVGSCDGVAGVKFTEAVKHYQEDKGCISDGVITAKKNTWKSLLGLM